LVSISLAQGNSDLHEMPRTKNALDVLYEKVERIYNLGVRELAKTKKEYMSYK
jgi:hypothetical protein